MAAHTRTKQAAIAPHFNQLGLFACFRDMGLDARCNARNVEAFVSKLGSYHTVWGIIPTKRGPSHYPALMVFGHDAEDNSIEITSPYFNQIIMRSRRESVKRDSLGNPVLKRNGTPVILPSHTHLINSGIKKERNTRAVEIVRIVTVMIEQTGDQGTPHISARIIIDRCSNLADNLAKCSSINQQNNLRWCPKRGGMVTVFPKSGN